MFWYFATRLRLRTCRGLPQGPRRIFSVSFQFSNLTKSNEGPRPIFSVSFQFSNLTESNGFPELVSFSAWNVFPSNLEAPSNLLCLSSPPSLLSVSPMLCGNSWAPNVGLEPTTLRLRVSCSTDWANRATVKIPPINSGHNRKEAYFRCHLKCCQ